MPTNNEPLVLTLDRCEPLVLTVNPPYVGSAVSPTVDITETSDDVTVTITDINGEHSYTIEKTDQAIADAEAAASAANNAASAASTAATRANTSANNADAATTAANSAAAAATAATVDTEAATAAANSAASSATSAAANANAAADRVDTAIDDAESAASAANSAATSATNAASAANSAASNANQKATLADTAATNANTKAGLADSAATAANSAAQSASSAASTASTAASNADAKATAANTAASAANTAATSANDAADRVDAALETLDDDLKISDSGSGSSVLTNGCALLDVEGDGWAEQDGTPTPENPQEVRVAKGRNLLESDSSSWALGNLSSGIYTNGGSQFCPINTSQQLNYRIPVKPVNGYVVKAYLESETYAEVYCGVHELNSDGTFLKDSSWQLITGNGYQFTTLEETAYVRVTFRTNPYNSGTSNDMLSLLASGKLRIQLEAGSIVTPYVPYGHVGLRIKGKNLLEARELYTGTVSNSYFIDFIFGDVELEAGVTYTLAADVESTVDNFGFSVGVGNNAYARDIYSRSNLHNGRISLTFTSDASTLEQYGNKLAFRVPRYSTQKSFTYKVSNVKLETGSTATPYFDSTIPVPIPSDGLAALPDGTHDTLKIDSAGHVTIEKRVGYVASYDGETVGDVYISTTGELSTGASVYYKLTTPTTIDLGYIDLPLMPDGCTVSIPELHEIDVEWVVTRAEAIPEMVSDVRKWALHEIALAGDAELSTIAAVENATASTNYAVGSYLVHAGILYRVTTAIATGETITPGGNVTATTVMAELIRLTA